MTGLSPRKNFTSFETEVVLREVEKFKAIIENKCTNALTNNQKTAAWMEISKRFNSTPGVNRRKVSQLQGHYVNLKRRAMKKRAQKRIDILKTGGGPPSQKINPIEERLARMGVLRKPLLNIYYDDHDYHTETLRQSSSDTVEITSEDEQSVNSESEDVNEIPGLTGGLEETPASKKSPYSRWKIKRKTPSATIAAQHLKMKTEVEIKLRQEEHELLMAQRREEHIMNMKMKEEQHKMQMAIMSEKLEIFKNIKEMAAKGIYKGSLDT